MSDRTEPKTDGDDARAVINLVNAVFTAIDARDWRTYRSLMHDQVRIGSPGVGSHKPGLADADHLVASTSAALGPIAVTQHMLTNHVVDIDGDKAHITFYEHALHHHPALGDDPDVNTWVLFIRATRDAIRTEQGWRVSGASMTAVHQTGNANLIADVAALTSPSDLSTT